MIRAAIAIVLLLLLIYGVREAYPLLAGPEIRIDAPQERQAIPSGEVLVSGVASRTETLYLNGGPLLIDQDGNFSTSLTLPQGGAILSLTATDRFGRTRTMTRTIYILNAIDYGSEEESIEEDGSGSEGADGYNDTGGQE